MSEISLAEVDQAEAALKDAKEAYYASGKAPEETERFREVKREIVAIRQAYRIQEEAAGRRTGLAGGDAVKAEV
jgi:hypothetical protein